MGNLEERIAMSSRPVYPLSTKLRTWAVVPLLLSAVLVAACGVSEEELAEVQTELSGVVQQQQTLQEEQSALAADVTNLQGGLTKVEGDLGNLGTETSTLKNDAAKAQADASTASQEVRSLTSQFGDLKNSFTLTRDEVATSRDKIEKMELAQASALKLARLSLIFDLYNNLLLTNSESAERAAHLAIGSVVIQADDPGLVTRWNPLADTWTKLFDGEFETAAQLVREISPREDAFLNYLRIAQEQTLDGWDE